MNDAELPLLDLFARLREADLPLGIDEYRTLLRALQLGFGVGGPDALRRLCRVLWVKSPQDHVAFDYHFNRLVQEWERGRASREAILEPPTPKITRTEGVVEQSPKKAEPIEPPKPPVIETEEKSPPPAVEQPVEPVAPPVLAPQEADLLGEMLQRRTMPLKRFVMTGEYLPVSRREMKQNWRYLRRMVREGAATELDVEQTVLKIGREGVMLEPVLVPPRINRTELLLLVDQGGSMVPFHALSRQLVETALRGGRLGRAGVYYFHNVPGRYLYLKPGLIEERELNRVFSNLHRDRTVCLIVSDAGAARSNLLPRRIQQTEAFVSFLESRVRRVAWLNPMPRSRWDATSAGEIAKEVPMFEFTRHGMDQAVDALRGRFAVLTQT